MPGPTILLLNPPGKSTYLRDYYCSKISQADYLNHPIDLLFQSGFLQDCGEVQLLDAIVDRLPVDACLERMESIDPFLVLGLIGSVSYGEDLAFYRRLKQRISARLVLTGDILIEDRVSRMAEFEFADAFLHDFSSPDLRAWIQGAEPSRLSNLTLRRAGTVLATPIRRQRGQMESFPVPRHDLFLGKNYRYPFLRSRRFATLLTEFGCPYPCNFCVMSTLGWNVRPLESVFRELTLLAGLGIRELLILDQTFAIDKSRASALLEGMEQMEDRFGWVCFSRPDLMEPDLLSKMRRAGCHTIILGLESGSERVLATAQKGYGRKEIRQGFSLCRDHGIGTVATVILGLPEETLETFEATLDLLREVDPDYVSLNLAVPRMGTPLRRRAIELGLIDPATRSFDQSGRSISMPTLTLDRKQVKGLRRRAVRETYLNFRMLKKRSLRLVRQGTREEWMIHLRQGAAFLRNQYRGG